MTAKGDLVGSINWDNPLLATSILGLTWDLTSKSDAKNAEMIREAIKEFSADEDASENFFTPSFLGNPNVIRSP